MFLIFIFIINISLHFDKEELTSKITKIKLKDIIIPIETIRLRIMIILLCIIIIHK